jgi:valyl-tRNA synthetase
MDPEYSRCVQKVFVELYKKGLIYRGKRMVNWCPVSLTALSDEEVIMKEQKGSLYYFKVEVVDATPSSHNVAATPSSPVVTSEAANGGARANLGDAGVAATKPTGPIIENGKVYLLIATTRPETIPGDTAVAVNPKDPRYTHLIGKHIVRPLPPELPREQKLIPIIGDEHVDFEFGTGVLKVTPAHDKADFEIGQRHKLAQIEVISANGHMNELAGTDLNGLDRFKARKVATEKLVELGALEKEEPYTNNVGFSERADVPIEPRLSEQWFLKYPSVEKSRACVAQNGEGERPREPHSSSGSQGSSGASPSQKMCFHPDRWAKVYDHWMGNIQDWCISRQLWWGHRIPVWSIRFEKQNFRKLDKSVVDNVEMICKLAGTGTPDGMVSNLISTGKRVNQTLEVEEMTVGNTQKPENEIHFRLVRLGDNNEFELHALTSTDESAHELERTGFTQDPDVLDTWFSSWLWPFATMGWTGDKPQDSKNPTLQAFYPTTDLVTGPDIIFFWVARMIMAGYEFMGDLPFQNVYFTGIIRDKQGRKMSKSLGNSPDPLDLIAKFGADALRFGTMRSAPLGQDILFDEQNVELGRNFCNKLWNACRFRQMMSQRAADILSADQTSTGSQNFRQNVGSTFEVQGEINPALLSADDKWILLKLDQAIREMNTAFAEYKFSDATATLYRFFWSEYCDWYVEASKAVLSGGASERGSVGTPNAPTLQRSNAPTSEASKANTLAVIDFILSHTLRLFHPFLPFITEELWHGMGYAEDMPENQGGRTIMFAPWPKPLDDDFKSHYGLTGQDEKHIEARNELVTQGRNLRRTGNIPASKKVKFIFKPARELAAHETGVLKLLLNAEAVEIHADYQPKKGTPTVRTELGDLYLPLEGLIDVEAEKARLKKELEKAEAELTKVQQKLNNPAFTQKVPPNVLAEHQKRLADGLAKKEHILAALAALQG